MGHVHDGLDTGILYLARARQYIRYAGARRPLYMVREGVLTEIKGDLRSVGSLSHRAACFTNHDLRPEVGTMFYLTTDGFADQNNPQGKKYGPRRLKSLRSPPPVDAQCQRLEQVLRK